MKRTAEHHETEREATRLLPGFVSVEMRTGPIPGARTGTQGASVTFYECTRCGALLRPLVETQRRHAESLHT